MCMLALIKGAISNFHQCKIGDYKRKARGGFCHMRECRRKRRETHPLLV